MKKILTLLLLIIIGNSLYSASNISAGLTYSNYSASPFVLADSNKIQLQGLNFSLNVDDYIFLNKNLTLFINTNYFIIKTIQLEANNTTHKPITFAQDVTIAIKYSKPIFDKSYAYLASGLHLGSLALTNFDNFDGLDYISHLSYQLGISLTTGIKINLLKSIFLDLSLQQSIDFLQWANNTLNDVSTSGFSKDFFSSKTYISCLLSFKI